MNGTGRVKMPIRKDERAGLTWLKAQASCNNGACVEIAASNNRVVLRDSMDPDGPILVYTHAEFAAFLDGARNGEFDHFVNGSY